MARNKNALRKHYVAPYVDGAEPAEEDWLLLAKYIQTAENDNNESVEDNGYYDGDGTPEQDVTSIAVGYSFSGFLDLEDPAQALIAGMEFEKDEDRKVWFKRVDSNGENEHVGKATVSGIVAGGGDATAYEAFACNIRWDRKPETTAVAPEV